MTKQTIDNAFGKAIRRVKSTFAWLLMLSIVWNSAALPLAGNSPRDRRSSKPASKSKVAAKTLQGGGGFIIWGPQQVVRQPINTTWYGNFTLPAGAIPPYTMTVSNGAPDGTRKVTQACVKLNGANVLSPTCYHSLNPTPQTRTVSLLADNAVQVQLIGPVLSYITITVTGSQASFTVSPASGNQGQTLTATLTGTGTNWAQGQTAASFGGEITVNSLTVNSATSATAQIAISQTAALAPRTVTMTTGSEVVSAADAFTVNAATPPGAASSAVTTLAGSAGNPGFIDGSGASARFRSLAGVAAAPPSVLNDVVYVADAGNHAIRRVDSSGAVTTTAGNGNPGFLDGQGANAQFNNPQGVAIDAQGVLYVADTGNHSIRRIDAAGNVTTLAGDGASGFVNGAGAAARFNNPKGVAVDTLGRIYVADTGNHAVRRIDSIGNVITVAGDGTAGSNNSPNARFNGLAGIAADGVEIYLYIADGNNHRIRRLDNNNTVITLAGLDRGFKDGTASESRFADPTGVAVDGAGHVIVADTTNSLARQIDPARAINGDPNAVFTIAGTGGRGSTDGAGNAAKFDRPAGVAVLGSSAVIVADTANSTLRKILLPPTIASLNPSQGIAGTNVTIAGTRFDARGASFNTVRFAASGGGTVTASVSSATRTQLGVTVPAGAVTGAVTVQTAGGTSNGVTFTVNTAGPPTIAAFNPKTGPIGTLVTITGANLKVGTVDPAVTFAGAGGTRLPALVAFSSATEVRATAPNATVTGVIQLTTSAGTATSSLPFTVAPSQDYAITLAPSSTTVVQGSTATYVVSITSPQTTFTQLVRLSATGLPSGAAATFNPSQITAGGTSTLSVKLSPVISPTSYSFNVSGLAPVDGSDLGRTAGASFTVMAAGSTTLAGRVLSTENVPIPNCAVSAPAPSGSDVTATTDGAGNFLLIGLQSGPKRPIFIQPPTGSVYPAIKEPADVAANQYNTVPYTFYLPAIDPLNTPINPNGPTDVTSARVPGLKMTIPQGVRLRVLGSSADVTHVSITPVPFDRTPAPLPGSVRTPLVFTSQPGNACVVNASNQCFTDDSGPKIPVVYPNLSGANPGTQIPLWSFDHNTVSWYQYGTGTVSADGKTIAPNAGVGLRDFSWHLPVPPPDGNPGDSDGGPGGSCPTNRGPNPVDYSTGIKIETMTDISFGGARGGLSVMRTYTSELGNPNAYPGTGAPVYRFGVGTKDNYDIRLTGAFTTGTAGRVVWPEQVTGRLFSYDAALSASGTATFTTTATTGQLGDTVRRIDAVTLEYRSTGGAIMRFEPHPNGQYYRLKTVRDRNGNVTTLNYDGSNNLTSVTDAVGRSIAFAYNAPNCAECVRTATDPLGRVTTYSYNGSKQLTGVTDALGKTMSYGYGVLNSLTSVTDRRGNVVKQIVYENTANGSLRVTSQSFADGGTERYLYTLSGLLVSSITIIDALGRTMTKRFNGAGYVIEETDRLGQPSKIERTIGTNQATKTTGPCGCAEATRTFDSRGQVTSITDRLNKTESWQYRTFANPSDYDPLLNQITQETDKLGRVTGYGYDAVTPNSLTPRGNMTSMTNALNQVTTYGYDGFGRMTSVTDALNHAVTMSYDANGYVNAQTDALNHSTTFLYDLVGNQTRITDALGRQTQMAYDNLDRLLTSIDPTTATTTYAYDENGNTVSVTDALNRTWTFTYDKKNRQETMKDPPPLNRVTRMQYDAADQLIIVISASGRTMRYTYDERGKHQTITDGLGNNVSFDYNNRGNLTTLKDQRNNTTVFNYDELFRLTGRRDPLGRLVTAEYDAVGNVTAQTDRMGRRTTIVYDNINRPANINYVDSTVTNQFDAAGRLTSVSDSSGTITWQYDNANRVTAETTNLGTVSYGYNNADERTSMTVADRPSVNYGYDAAGRFQTISQTMNGVTELFTYGYDALSRRTQLQRQANGAGIVTTDYEYDEISRLKRLKHTRVSTGTPHEDFQ